MNHNNNNEDPTTMDLIGGTLTLVGLLIVLFYLF